MSSSHGLDPERDPAPGRHVPSADEIPEQPLSEIVVNPPPRPTRIPVAPPEPERRAFDITIDGVTVSVREGDTILDACRAQGLDIPTLCYLDTLTPVKCLPRLRRRGQGRPRPRPRVLAQGRARHGHRDRL